MMVTHQQLVSILPKQLRAYLGPLRRKVRAHPLRTEIQKNEFLESHPLETDEFALVRRASSRIHYQDGMFNGSLAHYYVTGLVAIRAINKALHQANLTSIQAVLDLPCGYGRILRLLAHRFPNAQLTACDIQPEGVEFCSRAFGAAGVYSSQDLSEVSFDTKFDLIWCGSLITHLDGKGISDLLGLFRRHLSLGGIAVFTTLGNFAFDRMRREESTYDLPKEYIPTLTTSYERIGYGFHDYPEGLGYFDYHEEHKGYGVSITSPEWIRARINQVGGLQEVYFEERGWGEQDVFGYVKHE